uniref:Uncharacterized protein n=1 Tax=Oryza glaberrima TaxID=4538 RepID=I1QIG5_ORYGL
MGLGARRRREARRAGWEREVGSVGGGGVEGGGRRDARDGKGRHKIGITKAPSQMSNICSVPHQVKIRKKKMAVTMVWLGVGDEALEAIGSSCSALENLSLDNLNKCSDRLNNGFFFMSIIFQRNLVIDLPMVHMYGVGLGVQSPACDVCQDRLLQNTAYKYWTADIIGQSVASLNVTSGRSWTYNLWMARSGSARRRLPWTPKYCEHYMPVRSGIILIVMVLLVYRFRVFVPENHLPLYEQPIPGSSIN